MSRRTFRAPLLVTRCDRCLRRRACYPVWPGWLCRQCIERVRSAGFRALVEFGQQARKGGR